MHLRLFVQRINKAKIELPSSETHFWMSSTDSHWEHSQEKKKNTQKTLSFHISLVSKKDKKADGIKMELEPKMVSLDLIQQTYGNHYIKKGICALRS